jgi:hypothetical protein
MKLFMYRALSFLRPKRECSGGTSIMLISFELLEARKARVRGNRTNVDFEQCTASLQIWG